jgi:hypothetical protein
MGNHVPFIGHAPLPLDCQDLSQFEWSENFSMEPNPPTAADRQPRRTCGITPCDRRGEKGLTSPKPGAWARDTQVHAG